MSTKIRLSRGGRKKLPFYSIVATNSSSRRDSKFLEKIGTYNPTIEGDLSKRVTLKQDRAEYWLSVGAKPSDRVAGLLIEFGVAGAEKYKPSFTPKAKGTNAKKKALEAAAKKAEALKEAQEAKKAEEAAAKEAAAAPKEEAPAEEKTEAAPAEEKQEAPASEAEEKTEEAKA